MAHDQKTRNAVRANYIKGLPLNTAAQAEGVPYATARAWKTKAAEGGDDWDVVRNARRLTQGGVDELTGQILQDLAEQFVATIEAMKTATDIPPQSKAEMLAQLSDSYVKTIRAAGSANPKLNRLSVAMDVIKELNGFIGTNYPKLREQFVDIIDAFGPELVRNFSA
jgi:transposase